MVILLPLVQLGRLLSEYTVNVPFLDDWSFVPMDEKRLAGTLTMHDFFAAHLEHRIAFLRAVVMLCHHFWLSDYTKQTWVSYGFLCLTYLNVGLLMRRTFREPFQGWWWLLALAGVSIFSPVQYQVFLWLILHQVTCILFFLTAGVLVWMTRWPLWLRFFLGAFCALCPTLTFASGLLLWVVLMPVILWCAPARDGRQRVLALAGWFAVFVITLFLYFYGLKNEADPSFALGQDKSDTMEGALRAFFSDPVRAFEYVPRVLGGHLARGISLNLMPDAFWLGLLLVVLWLAALGIMLRHFRNEELRARLLPWLMLGAYSVGATTFVAMGRLWVTKSGINALSGRYVVHAVPLMLAVPALAFTLWHEWRLRRPDWRSALDRVTLAVGVALAVSQIIGWNYGERLMENLSASRRHIATSILFYKTDCPVEGDIDPNPELARKADDLGMLKPPMLKNLRLDNFLTNSAPLQSRFAQWKSLRLEKTPGGLNGLVDGVALLRKRGRVADGVLLTWFDPSDKHWEIFHVTNVTAFPFYLREAYVKDLEYTDYPGTSVQDALTHFEATFKLADLAKKLPKELNGVVKVAAWAYDQTGGDIALVPGAFQVDVVNGTVKSLGESKEAVDFEEYVARTGRKARHGGS
jgi:hypothetical protein